MTTATVESTSSRNVSCADATTSLRSSDDGQRLHDVVQRVQQVVRDRHPRDLVERLLLPPFGLEPELAGEPTDERGEQHDDRREDPGAQRVLGDAGERVGQRDRRTGERGGGETFAVAPRVGGEDDGRQRGEDERARPVAGDA